MAKKIPVVQVSDDNVVYLIEEGCKLDAKKKLIEEKLEGIKTELTALTAGAKYKTPKGKIVTISSSPVYSAIDPSRAKRALLDKRLGKTFFSCVKVHVTEFIKHVTDSELSELRKVTGHIRKHSFNK